MNHVIHRAGRRPCRLSGLLLLFLAANGACSESLSVRTLALPGQAQGSVLATARGFLLSWLDREGEVAVLRYAELDDEGRELRRGEVARGERWFVNWADFPSLIIAENGDWLAYTLVKSDPSVPYAYDILTTRSTDAGETWSPLAVLHDDGTPTEHGFVSLLPDGDDRVLAIWLDGRRTGQVEGAHDHGGAHTTLRSAVLTRAGVVERLELDDLTCDCCRTAVAAGPGGPVVAYRDRTAEEIRDIFSVSRGEAGWSDPYPVAVDGWEIAGCPVNGPALVRQEDALLAAWPTHADGTPTLRLAKLSDGTWVTLPALDRGADLLGRVDLAPWGDGTTLAVWIGKGEDGHALFLARIDAAGTILEQHTVTELPPGRATGMPRMASHDGRALLVWTLPGASGSRLHGALITRARQ